MYLRGKRRNENFSVKINNKTSACVGDGGKRKERKKRENSINILVFFFIQKRGMGGGL